MDLILWRHAEAEDGLDDLARALTPKGHKQARAMAAWLGSRLPDGYRLMVSRARRSQQTAAALSDRQEVDAGIDPGQDAASVLRAAGWPDGEGTVVVVGHQPTLGEVAARLTDSTEGWSVKKGAILWFRRRDRGYPDVQLYAVLSPDLLD